jgi:hypothetical protein
LYRWTEGQEKVDENQQMLFQLYDHNKIPLDDSLQYENSNFFGNEIFSYRVRNQGDVDETGEALYNDVVLGFPLTFKGLKQTSDIVFENNLEVDRYTYGPDGFSPEEIVGYYFFRYNDPTANPVGDTFETNWVVSTNLEKQRVIDRYLGDGDTSLFSLSAPPTAEEDVYVRVAGRRLSDEEFSYYAKENKVQLLKIASDEELYVGDGTRIDFVFFAATPAEENQIINIYVDGVYQEENTDGNLDYNYTVVSYTPFSIRFNTPPPAESLVFGRLQEFYAPAENNIVEVITHTHASLADSSIGYFEVPNELENNPNNEDITENSWNELASHFVSIIENQLTYTGQAFGAANNYRDTAKDGSAGTFILQNQAPLVKAMLMTSTEELDIVEAIRLNSREYTRYKNKFVKIAGQMINEGFTPFNSGDLIPVNQWVDEAIRRIVNSREYSDAFKDTYMIAWSNIFLEEVYTSDGIQKAYTLTEFIDLQDKKNVMYVYNGEDLLLLDQDYVIVNYNPIQIEFAVAPALNSVIVIRLYEDVVPAHLPATPSKQGIYPVQRPEIVTDNSYATPLEVIIGHDGSRTPVYNDYRDAMLLEFERRIYNGIIGKFRNNYKIPIDVKSLRPGKFRDTRWSNSEWKDIVDGSFFKWTNENRVDYRANDYYDDTNEWSWNYRSIADVDGEPLAGYWRGIFDYYYDTQTPHLTPWEMLGFAKKPAWWESGTPLDTTDGFRGYGVGPWSPTSGYGAQMWQDLEAGHIRRGSRAGIDTRYARPGLIANYLPVDNLGNLKATPLECIDTSASLQLPTESAASARWMFGDMGPAEYAWHTSESYPFAMAEAMFLTRPAEFGEKFWDPEHLYELVAQPEQIVTNENGLYKRTGNTTLVVHGETENGSPVIQTGYQVWIAALIRSLGQDITTSFGNKIRSLNVKLGHKMAGFTDRDTMRVFVEGISVSARSANLLVPAENIRVDLHTGAPVREYVYSGVLVKKTERGTYEVYGYDILAGKFTIIPRRSSPQDYSLNIGGQPETFINFTTGRAYEVGTIVRFNTIFYRCSTPHFASKFIPENWTKLSSLPISGGVTVTYKPNGLGLSTIEYGHEFTSTQDTFDFLIAYGDYLESQGFVFQNTKQDVATVQNWLNTGKEFLFWAGSRWEPNSVIMLSPGATGVELNVSEGYPASVEKVINGVYSILDKAGVVIDPVNTNVKRSDRNIRVEPLLDQGIFSLRVNTTETENILTFDNVTDFNDVLYDPKLGTRQERLVFNGRRTKDWIGKLEAAGYIITEDGLLPNLDNLADSIRLYHDIESIIDNPQMEQTARHLIGYEPKEYLDALQTTDETQYQFYQGMIRQKGTRQSVEKIERNKLVNDIDQDLVIYEDWALKLGEFGSVNNNQMTEFLIRANEVKQDPQLVELSYVRSLGTGSVTSIDILSATNIWTIPPTITIVAHPDEPVSVVGATATAILDSTGKLSRIDILTNGSGYSLPPYVYVGSTTLTDSSDRAVANITYDIEEDVVGDDVLLIDVDDNERWLIKPASTAANIPGELWPSGTLLRVTNALPNAGYVHPMDVDWQVFSVYDLQTVFDGTTKPVIGDLIWVAQNENEDWTVFEYVNAPYTELMQQINEDTVLDPSWGIAYEPGLCVFTNDLDFYVVPDSANHLNATIVLNNTIYKYERRVPTGSAPGGWYFYVLTLDEIPVEDAQLGNTDDIVNTPVRYFYSVRYTDRTHRNQNTGIIRRLDPLPEIYWIDNDNFVDEDPAGWAVKTLVPVSGASIFSFGPTYVGDDGTTRVEQPLVLTPQFKNAFIYEYDTKDTLLQLPVYDPFKGVLSGIADQNLSYKTRKDPARYTNASDVRLIDDNRLFDNKNVGQLWWDLSTCAYIYYEQGTNKFRRDNWGTLFTGSSVDVYEWVRSVAPPAEYAGDGTVRNITDYVFKQEWDPLIEEVREYYYFWVKNRTVVPAVKNRTLAGFEVARLIQNPKAENYRWFSPISDNAFVFSGVEGTFTDSDNVFQINFLRSSEELKKHVEWELGREGDRGYIPNDIHWNKMVDSLVGLTIPVPIGNSSADANFPPLDNFNDAIPVASQPGMGYLVVPAPNLSEHNRYGIKVRPQQTMFKDMMAARKILVNKINELVAPIMLRDTNYAWNASLTSNTLWEWVDWYEEGWNATNVLPTRQVNNVAELNSITNAFQSEVVKVLGPRASFYAYDQINNTWTMVCKKATRLQLKDAIYTNPYNLPEALELRELINAIRSEVFVMDAEVNINLVFFAMLNYVFSEQQDIDWAFKTSYIFVNQTGQELTQTRVYQEDPFNSVLEYVKEIKPYQTKIRDYKINRSVTTEGGPGFGTAEETVRDFRARIFIDKFMCSLSVAEMRIAKREGKKSPRYNGYTTLTSVGDRIQFLYNSPPPIYPPGYLPETDAQITRVIYKTTDANFGGRHTIEIQNGVWDGSITAGMMIIVSGSRYNNGTYTVYARESSTVISVVQSVFDEDDTTPTSVLEVFQTYGPGLGPKEVRLGAAGRFVNQQRDLLQYIADVDSDILEEYTPEYSFDFFPWDMQAYDPYFLPNSRAVSTQELNAVAEINRRMCDEFACDFEGIFHINTTFSGRPSLVGLTIAAPGTGYVVGDILWLDAGGGTPVAAAAIQVTQIGVGGAITGYKVINGGSYYVTPVADPVNLLGGTGAGATATGLIFVSGDTIPWDAQGWDTQGWDSNGNGNDVASLDGLGNATTPPSPLPVDQTGWRADPVHNFTNIPAEETFTGNGGTREFTITTTTPTFFMFVVVDNVEMRLNIDYFFIGSRLVFIDAPSNNATIQLFTYIEAGDLINPQVSEGITEEMLPLDPRENLVLTADHQVIVIDNAGAGYTEGDILTIVGGTGTATTLRVLENGVSGGGITRVAIETEGEYTVEPTYPASVTGGTGNSATFTILPSYSFRYHYDTQQGVTYLRNSDAHRTHTLVAVNATDMIIPVADVAVLEEHPTTIDDPNIAWIGNERIEFYAVDYANNLLLSVKRGTKGTGAPVDSGTGFHGHPPGTKVFAGGPAHELPDPEIYWVNSVATNLYNGTAGQWRDNGDGFAYFSDTTNNLFNVSPNARIKDTLKITGTDVDGKYFIYGRINVGELSIVDITAAGTGYSVGDIIQITGDGTGAQAIVGQVGPGGEVLLVKITNRGSGYTTATMNFGFIGDGNATATVVVNRQALILSCGPARYTPSGRTVAVDGITWQTDGRNNGGLYNSTTPPALFILGQPGNALPKTV